MNAFVEFGHETSYNESAEFKTLLKMVPYGACFHFIGLFCHKTLTLKVEKTCKKAVYR